MNVFPPDSPVLTSPEAAVQGVELEPIAVDAKGAGRLFLLSERTWRRLDSGGDCPASIRVGRSKRWLVSELKQWSHCGSPTTTSSPRTRSRR